MEATSRRGFKGFFAFKREYLSFPYALFLLLFVVFPIFIILVYAFTETVTDPSGMETLHFSWNALVSFFTSTFFSATSTFSVSLEFFSLLS